MSPCSNLLAAIALGAALSIDAVAATSPIPDLAYGGSGDGVARIAAAGVPADSGFGTRAVVQADGALVLLGTAKTGSVEQAVLTRFDANGLPDSDFGPAHDGFYRTAFTGSGDDVVQTADGKLVYAGHASNFEAMLVGRLDADGVPDVGFFGSGRRLIGPSALLDEATQGYFANVLPLPDGKLLALGMVVIAATPAQYFACALRLHADGATDTAFGVAGRTCIAPNPSPGAAAQFLAGHVLADGRTLIAGASKHSGGSGWDMSVTRLDAGGALDASFGPAHDGWAFVGFDQGGTMTDGAFAIAIDGQGRILIAGYLEGVHGLDIGVARLLPDGQPDASFGTQGRVQIALDFGDGDADLAHSIAVRPDGGILVGGRTDVPDDAWGSHQTAVAILLKSDGQLDPRFGDGGIFLQSDSAAPRTAAVDGSQQILAGDFLYMVGDVLNADSRYDFAATRFVLPLFADGFDR